MDAKQLRMARVALNLTVRQAAEICGVSHDTITRIEAGRELKGTTLAKVKSALETAGVEFIPENGGGAGVRLKKRLSGNADNHAPTGPATEVVKMMDAAIEDHAKSKKRN